MKVDLLLPRFPDIAARTFPTQSPRRTKQHFSPPKPTQFVREQGIELVIPITEWTNTLPLARHRAEIERFARLALPSLESLETAADKFRTIEIARELGVPVPETRLFTGSSKLDDITSENFPAVVKDRYSVRWKDGRAASWVPSLRLFRRRTSPEG